MEHPSAIFSRRLSYVREHDECVCNPFLAMKFGRDYVRAPCLSMKPDSALPVQLGLRHLSAVLAALSGSWILIFRSITTNPFGKLRIAEGRSTKRNMRGSSWRVRYVLLAAVDQGHHRGPRDVYCVVSPLSNHR